ncbi:MAG: hypothetical protein MUP81_02440 [Dehalococcoidia bacterium]|nr:hypothetical protein [Dehalococcoidia bacterium]
MPALQIKDMGPCEIVWGYGELWALTLGPFLGATTYKGETSVVDIQEEGYGEAAVDAITTGTVATLELRMTRSTLDQLDEVFNPVLTGIVTDSRGDYMVMRNNITCEMYDVAASVVIKPICDNVVSADPLEWVQIYKAFPVPGWELTWDRATQRVFPITFKIFVNQDSPGEIGAFGTMGMDPDSTPLGI